MVSDFTDLQGGFSATINFASIMLSLTSWGFSNDFNGGALISFDNSTLEATARQKKNSNIYTLITVTYLAI